MGDGGAEMSCSEAATRKQYLELSSVLQISGQGKRDNSFTSGRSGVISLCKRYYTGLCALLARENPNVII